MRNIKIAALQFSCCSQVQENIDKAETMVREAASNGANLILLPELFERPYFCQEKRYDYYDYALPLTENPAVRRFQAVAGELGVVIPVSFYERDVQRLFNSIAMIDADGSILGVYRKTHIPDDHFYQEKFYFTPGDTGFKVFETRFGTVGVGICWDQWFPETARCMAVQGAEILLYPTAIGSEPILNVDSSGHWRRVITLLKICGQLPGLQAVVITSRCNKVVLGLSLYHNPGFIIIQVVWIRGKTHNDYVFR